MAWADALKAGPSPLTVDPEVSVRLGDDGMPTADLVVWDPIAAPGLERPGPVSVVSLVVEVADSTLEDGLGDTMRAYAAAGVPEYRVADLQGRVVRVHHKPGAQGYGSRTMVAFGDTVVSPTLGLECPTAGL